MRSNGDGFVVTSATENLKNEVYYEDNRIVQEKFYRFSSGSGDVQTTDFELWYTINYDYKDGKLVQQTGLDGDEIKSKRQIEYDGDQPVRYKRFYKQSNGSLKMIVKQGFTPAHEQYFPELTAAFNSGNTISAFGNGSNEPLSSSSDSPQSPVYESPSYNSGASGNGIVRELESTPRQSLSSESLQLDKESQALLDQIKMLANANSTESITDAQILHLALQQLVDSHRAELKELNQKYLESQQTMFD
jgi:hypothetical protein